MTEIDYLPDCAGCHHDQCYRLITQIAQKVLSMETSFREISSVSVAKICFYSGLMDVLFIVAWQLVRCTSLSSTWAKKCFKSQ